MPRQRKPTTLHRLEGTRPERGLNAREPEGTGRPRLPSGDVLTPKQQLLWKAIVSALPVELLTRADEVTLERAAIAWDYFRQAVAGIEREGLLVAGREGAMVRHPLLIVMRQATAEMEQASAALGLSPAARTRITLPEKASDDPLTLLLGPQGNAWRTAGKSKLDS